MLRFLSIKLIRFYQKHLSFGTCKYLPTCSQYMIEAILKHGFFVGLFFGIKRILRCTPWAKGGVDKVPDKRNVLKWVY